MSWLRSFSLRGESLVRVREKCAGGGATNARETSTPPPPISGKFRPLKIISKQDWNTFWPFNTVKCQTITLSAVFAWYNIISTSWSRPYPCPFPLHILKGISFWIRDLSSNFVSEFLIVSTHNSCGSAKWLKSLAKSISEVSV